MVLGHVAVSLASARTHRVIAQEALLAEFRDRHRGLAGRARLFQESARVTLFILGHLVGPLVRLVGTRGLVLAVGGPVDTDVARAGSAGSLDHVRHVRPPGNVLDEMLETGTDSRLQPTPLPNKKVPLTSHFMNSIVRSAARNRFTAT